MQRIETALPGVYIIEPRIYGDERGWFFESYRQETFAQIGIHEIFVQDNRSFSHRGVLRGLHYQLHYPQAKLCTVVQGEVFDVAVDIRKGSPTFSQWVGVLLSAENRRQLFIPGGFAHGFAVLSESAQFMYKCSDYYHPEDEGGVLWNDPALAIDWPLAEPRLSQKDRSFPTLAELPDDQLPAYQ